MGMLMLDAVSDRPDVCSGIGLAELAQALLIRSETGLIALDADLHVVLANPAARELFGLKEPVIGHRLDTLLRNGSVLTPASVAAAEQWLDGLAEMPLFLPIDVETKLSVVSADGPDGHRLLSFKRQSRAAAPASRKDALTGLSDRTWFNDQLAALMAAPNATPALMLIDLDRFKAVNDSLGHQVGDALLQLVAKRLTGALRDADVICRLSGDEFAVLMKRPNNPEVVGRRLVALLSRPYLIEGSVVSVGASVGLALAPDHGRDPAALIRAADVALYAAKHNGRGAARVYDCELDKTTRHRQSIAEALRKAIPLDQFALHFQPQVVLESGELTGFEAFLRWDHPELGSLLPGAFLPVAEDTGLIWPIGEWVLRQACEQAVTWPSHLSVSVNVSVRQLLDRQKLPRMIKSALLRTGLAPGRLEIEVTERALTQQPEALAVLEAIHALGVRVSLDNFGTGYSSINHLRRFPLHKLKIDHSFIHSLGVTEEATNVVRAIAALGKTLGIVTIAEGVETADQENRVRRDGCTELQGYVLSRPVPANEVAGVIATLQASPRSCMQVV
jgi:diguanylate cyclase (GGDEF)-like protein